MEDSIHSTGEERGCGDIKDRILAAFSVPVLPPPLMRIVRQYALPLTFPLCETFDAMSLSARATQRGVCVWFYAPFASPGPFGGSFVSRLGRIFILPIWNEPMLGGSVWGFHAN